MPTEIKLWRIEGDRPRPVSQDKLDLEARLEGWIRDDVGLVNDGLLVIGQQVPTEHTGDIDLLAMDSEANLVILELKRDRTPRDIVAQTLDYASYVQKLGLSDIQEIVANADFMDGKSLEEAFSDKFGKELPKPVNQAHRMYIVASSLDSATERIVGYLSETHDVYINVATFAYFNVDGQEVVGRSMLLDEEDVETRAESRGESKRRRSLTQAELQEIAEGNGVGDLYRKALSELGSRFSRSPRTTGSTIYFKDRSGDPTAFSIIPGWSSQDIGLVIRIRHEAFSEHFSVTEDELRDVCGAEMRDVTDLKYDYWGGEHLFDADRLDRLVELLRENAPQG